MTLFVGFKGEMRKSWWIGCHKQPSQRSAKKLKTNGYLYSAPLSGLTSIATPQQMHRYFPQFMASYPPGLSHFTLET
ncbi:hypothetical protein ACUODJ_58855, partial [Escherichia sp. HC-CC]